MGGDHVSYLVFRIADLYDNRDYLCKFRYGLILCTSVVRAGCTGLSRQSGEGEALVVISEMEDYNLNFHVQVFQRGFFAGMARKPGEGRAFGFPSSGEVSCGDLTLNLGIR